MKIIIAGDGKVGHALTRLLSQEGHELVVIDSDPEVLENNSQLFDVLPIEGNCVTMKTLSEAQVEEAELLIAATNSDEINLLCCFTARKLNPNLHTIARVRSLEYLHQCYEMREDFGLSMTINPEGNAAKEIFRLLQFPGFLKRETFAKGRVEIVELLIPGDSVLCGVQLSKLSDVLKCKVLICAVVRDGNVAILGGNDTIKENDHIYVTAPTNVLSTLLASLNIITKKTKHVMIIGGGRISHFLAKSLISAGIKVKIIEQDEERCRLLSRQIPEAAIINADGSSQEVLDSEGLAQTNALVALTGLDEINIIMSLYAASRGVPQVFTKVNRMESTGFLEDIGINRIINPEELCSASIVQYVRALQNQTGAAVTLHHIAGGRAEALEFRVNEGTYFTNTPLKSVNIKKNILISCISHKGKTVIPDGNSAFTVGDTIIVVNATGTPILQLNDIFNI
ncbi:MAG: Trk system potassium transporter TrkA [Clostridiales bacterium]|nr:Trk system potassium transporter TrkA [Clostridiales bacterium]